MVAEKMQFLLKPIGLFFTLLVGLFLIFPSHHPAWAESDYQQTVRIDVTETYDTAIFTKLPYRVAAEAYMTAAGYTIVYAPKKTVGVELKIHAEGKALSETYVAKSAGYDRARKVRTGATLAGTILLEFATHSLAMKEFSGDQSGPEAARETDANPYRAPFRSLYRQTYLHQLPLLMYEQFGSGTVIKVLAHDDAEVRYSAAYVLGYTKEPSAVLPLIDKLKDPSALVRNQVVIALGEIKDPQAVESLIPLLEDNDPSGRRQAQDVLFAFDDTKAAKPLIGSFEKDLKSDDVLMRLQAVNRLGSLKNPGAIPPLTTALDDSDEQVRLAAAKALSQISSGSAADSLIDALKKKENSAKVSFKDVRQSKKLQPLLLALTDEDPEVRKSAAKALGEIQDPGIVHPLALAMADDDPRVAKQAEKSLDRGLSFPMQIAIKDLEEVLFLDAPALQKKAAELLEKRKRLAVSTLQKALDRGNLHARQYAAMTLGNLRHEESFELLIGALRDPDPEVRKESARALSKIKNPKAVKPLLEKLKSDKHSEVRQAAKEALYHFAVAEAAPDFLVGLQDKKRRVRKTCRYVLLQIQDPEVVPLYLAKLNHVNPYAKKTLVDALGMIGDSRAIIPMLPLLYDRSYWVRDHSYKSIRTIIEGMDDPRDIKPLVAALDANNGSVRNTARQKLGHLNELALGVLESTTATPPPDKHALEEQKDQTIPKVTFRRQMLKSLIEIGDPKAIDTLIQGLNDNDAVFRRLSAQGLGTFHSQKAVSPLIHALSDADPDVQASASRSLEEITGEKFGLDQAKWHLWWSKNKKNSSD